jgi:N-methylhydantoinase B
MAGAIGAFPERDGIDTGGVHWEPKSIMGNVEEQEQTLPVLYLYRRELPGSGGAGRFRGGNGAAFAVVPHGVDEITHLPAAAGFAVPTGAGLAGGYPACTNGFRLRVDTDVRARFEAGEMPTSLDLLGGRDIAVGPKERGLLQRADDVWEVRWCAGGGYGDPLERRPEAVAADVAEGRVDGAWARTAYGVAIEFNGGVAEVDAAATAALRENMRAARIGGCTAPIERDDSAVAVAVSAALELAGDGAARRWRCARCHAVLGERTANYKLGAVCEESSVTAANPYINDPALLIDAPLVLRRYHCPGCAVTLDTDVALHAEPPLHDLVID